MMGIGISDREFQREERRLLRFAQRAHEIIVAEGGSGRALCLEAGERAVHLPAALLADLDRLLHGRGNENLSLCETLIAWRLKANVDLAASAASAESECDTYSALVFDAVIAGNLLDRLARLADVPRSGSAALRPSSVQILRRDIEQDLAELLNRSGVDEEQLAVQREQMAWIKQTGRTNQTRERVVRSAAQGAPGVLRRRRILRMALALLGAVMMIGGALEVQHRLSGPWAGIAEGELTPDDFGAVRGVVSFEDRPPSVFVVVEQTYWLGLAPESRADYVSSLRQRIDRRGYEGLLVSLPDGEVVGLWRAADGVRVF